MKMHCAKVILFLTLTLLSSASIACGWDGCLFTRPKDFVSNAARDAQNMAKANVSQSLALVKSMSQGDVNGVIDHVGKLVVEGECLGCKQAISQVGGDAGVATVEQMVGVGFIALTNDDPLFITYDVASKKAFVSKPVPPEPGAFSDKGKVTSDELQSFEATVPAICIVSSTKDKSVVAGFKEPPPLKNLRTNAVVGWFDSTLGPGDKVKISAPLCPAENSGKNHQTSIDKVTIIYLKDSAVQRTGQQIRYELIGQRSE